MLHLYLEDKPNIRAEVIRDIDQRFLDLKLTGSELEKEAIKLIDKGEYINKTQFRSRYGEPTSIQHLSTGCKAVIMASRLTDKIVVIDECGFNARDYLINTLKEGQVYLSDTGITIGDKYNKANGKIDVALDKYRFTLLDRLNEYIFEERPFTPDMSTGGIEGV